LKLNPLYQPIKRTIFRGPKHWVAIKRKRMATTKFSYWL